MKRFFSSVFAMAWVMTAAAEADLTRLRKAEIFEHDNFLYTYRARRALRLPQDLPPATKTLRDFPLDMKWNRATIAGYEQQFGFTFVPTKTRARGLGREYVVPIAQRGKSWSAWVADPYSWGDRTADSSVEYNGHDYLLAYWLGRYHQYIDAEQ